jgi:hypothetical protein
MEAIYNGTSLPCLLPILKEIAKPYFLMQHYYTQLHVYNSIIYIFDECEQVGNFKFSAGCDALSNSFLALQSFLDAE